VIQYIKTKGGATVAEVMNAITNRINKSLDAHDAKLAGSSNIRHWNAATGEWNEISVIEARKQQAERRAAKNDLEKKKRQAHYLGSK
jgi:hypothetical protein